MSCSARGGRTRCPMRGRIAAFLEDGRLRSPTLSLLSAVYSHAARPDRRLLLPAVPVVGACGATLGGSSVTPVVLALARALDEAGTRAGQPAQRAATAKVVAVAGHGYRAAVSCSRRVTPNDDVLA